MAELKFEICQWLKTVFGTDFSVEIEGGTDKGDGYLGDIVYVKAQSRNNIIKNLCLKCSKRNVALRGQAPIKNAFTNEIYLFDTVFPVFRSFEAEHGIPNPFDNVAQFHGSYVSKSMEVIMLENLKTHNFILHNRRLPVTEKHAQLVLRAYGHFHAISAAMRDQKPESFRKLTDGLTAVYYDFCKATSSEKIFRDPIEECYELLKGEIPENVRAEWKRFGENLSEAMNIVEKTDRFTVITHADSWNNNFLFKGPLDDPEDVAILDWQISSLSTPILDLSFFLFTCLDGDGLKKNCENYLKYYYYCFAEYVSKLGSDPGQLYPYKKFLGDWKRYCQFGIMMSALLVKIALTEKEDCQLLEDAVNDGRAVGDNFKGEIKDKGAFIARMKGLVQYVVDNDLINN